MNKLIIISGPGGSGKDAVIDALVRDHALNLTKLVNYTSRQPRVGERDKVDYHFVSKADFTNEINNGNMLEYEVMTTNGAYYGTHKPTLDKMLELSNVICKKMPIGALNLKKHFGGQAITIFIDAGNEELRKRLGESARISEIDCIDQRIAQAHTERKLKTKFDYTFWNHNGELDQTVAIIRKIIA